MTSSVQPSLARPRAPFDVLLAGASARLRDLVPPSSPSATGAASASRLTQRLSLGVVTWALGATLLAACGETVPPSTAGGPGGGNSGDGDATGDGDAKDPNDSEQLDGGASVGPFALDECGSDNPADLSASELEKLKQGGSTSGMRFLYPYEGTVFPRGLKAPLLMWEGGSADAVYVHLYAGDFDYKGCLKPDADGQLQLPETVWTQAGRSTLGAAEPYTLELSTLKGSTAKGPIKRQIVIAKATISGSIFYNSYNTGSSGGGGGGFLGGGGGAGGGTGAVLRIQPGKDAEIFARQGTCTGCHSVSANGSRLVARELMGGQEGSVYQITPTTAANPAPSRAAANSSFVGLVPDGSVYVTSAARNGVGPLLQGGIGVTPNADARMFETDTGSQVNNTGIPTTAMMPTFSPDATKLAFNDYADGAGHTLSLMSYDAKTRKASGQAALYNHATLYPGWPFVLPDNGAVVFALGAEQVYDGNGVGISSQVTTGPKSDLAIVDMESKTFTLLAQAMGFNTAADAAADKTYLPFGSAEAHQAYYPTVSPVASGGYFWVFFDSMRHYGNNGLKRQLWGSAIQISADGSYKEDPSHPAFYVSGQDLDTANHRAFTALDPCKADGDSCKSGVDCCGGFCYLQDGEFSAGSCTSTTGMCAREGERCDDAGDCCDGANQCINGYCGTILLF